MQWFQVDHLKMYFVFRKTRVVQAIAMFVFWRGLFSQTIDNSTNWHHFWKAQEVCPDIFTLGFPSFFQFYLRVRLWISQIMWLESSQKAVFFFQWLCSEYQLSSSLAESVVWLFGRINHTTHYTSPTKKDVKGHNRFLIFFETISEKITFWGPFSRICLTILFATWDSTERSGAMATQGRNL